MPLAILLAITLTGRVIDARTGEPIRKALVSIRDQKAEVLTDDRYGVRSSATRPEAGTSIERTPFSRVRRPVRTSRPWQSRTT